MLEDEDAKALLDELLLKEGLFDAEADPVAEDDADVVSDANVVIETVIVCENCVGMPLSDAVSLGTLEAEAETVEDLDGALLREKIADADDVFEDDSDLKAEMDGTLIVDWSALAVKETDTVAVLLARGLKVSVAEAVLERDATADREGDVDGFMEREALTETVDDIEGRVVALSESKVDDEGARETDLSGDEDGLVSSDTVESNDEVDDIVGEPEGFPKNDALGESDALLEARVVNDDVALIVLVREPGADLLFVGADDADLELLAEAESVADAVGVFDTTGDLEGVFEYSLGVDDSTLESVLVLDAELLRVVTGVDVPEMETREEAVTLALGRADAERRADTLADTDAVDDFDDTRENEDVGEEVAVRDDAAERENVADDEDVFDTNDEDDGVFEVVDERDTDVEDVAVAVRRLEAEA